VVELGPALKPSGRIQFLLQRMVGLPSASA
jgi:hypothetical protein